MYRIAPSPPFVAEYENADWAAQTTSRSPTSQVTTAAGDLLVVCAVTSDTSVTLGTPSGGGLTYAIAQEVTTGSRCRVAVWTAPVVAAQTFTLTLTSGGNAFSWGLNCLRFANATVGASAQTNAVNVAPSLNLTTTQDFSAIVLVNGDWAPVDGASRTYRTPSGSTAAVEQSYFFGSGNYGAYVAYHANAGVRGSKTIGLTAPTGQTASVVGVEIKGFAPERGVPRPIQAVRRSSLY
jgi:hypothetical protein